MDARPRPAGSAGPREGATEREVWLPEGCWQLHGEGQELDGHATLTVDAPLDVLPWFARCGKTPI